MMLLTVKRDGQQKKVFWWNPVPEKSGKRDPDQD
jgi:hypothetical protein